MVRHGSLSARRMLNDVATPARSMALAEAAAHGAPKARIPRWLARHEQLGQAGLARKLGADAGDLASHLAAYPHGRITDAVA